MSINWGHHRRVRRGRNYQNETIFLSWLKTGKPWCWLLGVYRESNRIPFVVYVSAISFAEHSVYLTYSYFIPNDQIVKALSDAAGRVSM